MINPGVIYSVTGRYMDGQKIIGYHLVGQDGSQSQESKERVIYLINKGVIDNMRTQIGTDKEIIIRGKGVNLNNLPVFDPVKGQYRNNEVSQSAANTSVPVKDKVQDASPMGQYQILRRIMLKNSCIGYELQNYSGKTVRKSRDDVIKLGIERLLSNAIVQKYTKKGENVSRLILRGVDCDLSKLPILIVSDDGKIIDPKVNAGNLTIRGAYMKHSGIIHDSLHNKKIPFRAGDFILCGANGEIFIKDRLNVENGFKTDTESASAVCDDYLSVSSNYTIEIFGTKPIKITEKMIKSWAILKPNSAA